LYRTLSAAFGGIADPPRPAGPNAPVGDPFHIQTDIWDMRLRIMEVVYRLCDAASKEHPSVIGALHLGECDIHVRMPWQQNVLCTCQLPLQGIRAPPEAHLPISEYEIAVAQLGLEGWLGSLLIGVMLLPCFHLIKSIELRFRRR
jgi:hypothetical protein